MFTLFFQLIYGISCNILPSDSVKSVLYIPENFDIDELDKLKKGIGKEILQFLGGNFVRTKEILDDREGNIFFQSGNTE